MNYIPGGVTAPAGFRAAAVPCAIKYQNRNDLVLIVSETPSKCAGVFTSNRVKAAPVLLSRTHAARGSASAIVANSGNANACTGEQGLESAAAMAAETARHLDLDVRDVLVASTGVIGRRFPIERVIAGIPAAVAALSHDYSPSIAQAIMTTDTVPKEVAVEVDLGGTMVHIGAMAKGAGMIRPDMATLLCFITTDADIAPSTLKKALVESVDKSFNCITVDGDMSTNDTVFILANGCAGNQPIRSRTKNYDIFVDALSNVCGDLARAIVRDGEGATKFVTIIVTGSSSKSDARQAGLAIANSPLVKTALYGADPNWGRIICAAGYSGVAVDESNITISMNGFSLFERGKANEFDEQTLRNSLAGKEITIEIDLGAGRSQTTLYTTDLSHDYIKINAEYTT